MSSSKRHKKRHLEQSESAGPDSPPKLSQVLLEFMGERVPLDSPPHVLKTAMELAVIIWNIGLLPEDEQGERLMRLRLDLRRSKWGLTAVEEATLNDLLQLRKTRYAHDRRVVAKYEFHFEFDKPSLTVSWTYPEPLES